MDIPACTSATVGSTSPPPAYNDISKFPLYEEIIPASPPPDYTAATAPPSVRDREIPQNTNRRTANPYPVLNVPPQIEVVEHREQIFMQQIVQPVSPQVIIVQPQQMFVRLDDSPTATVCKYCHKSIITNVQYKSGSAAWGMCCLLTLLGLICGFCLIPFCVRGFKDAHHSCPYCNKHLGIYTRK
ncbi:lipopolysaccharide-induced tumor necrosis factor-alpha factor homolog [Puntigrus tetrazona]|uniref:lipopolysaccharide-induced tumor necrosis factor-alpha factor homolog n=1 Tax=Puntigrus tetrazona TaxID=1606681 RepID=UPI001C8A51BA|nr:lipopolysaccharide-induced tumor necrosis factor-alpha factor homolog [Puntigrus tetrazona]